MGAQVASSFEWNDQAAKLEVPEASLKHRLVLWGKFEMAAEFREGAGRFVPEVFDQCVFHRGKVLAVSEGCSQALRGLGMLRVKPGERHSPGIRTRKAVVARTIERKWPGQEPKGGICQSGPKAQEHKKSFLAQACLLP